MSRSKSSKNWLQEHFSDHYVKKAQQDGYRSRAAYKLLEIQEKDHLIKPGMTVVDLGAAPGGWSEIIVKLVGNKVRVIALDILPMDPIDGVEIIQGDFTTEATYQKLLDILKDTQIDIVVSDMAPNMSGIKSADQARSVYLAELALDFAKNNLKNNGKFLLKTFQGEGFDKLLQDIKQIFQSVKIRKPSASRSRSNEVYILAHNLKNL